MIRPLTQSDLIFPTQSLTMSSTLHSLKRSVLSITNRLNSISSDSDFVTSVSEAYDLPLIANERCGSWYIPPEKKIEAVYFKSTDGHMNEWGFSLRRLNLQLLDVLEKSKGCVIVDSTRRGKSMPDALSKTIPIWCCVLNRTMFPESGPHELHTPPQAVSASEHSQIESRIDGFVHQFLDICQPNIRTLLAKTSKPLRPIWITQTSTLPQEPPKYLDFHPVILCTASRRVHGAEASEAGYIQGAADDHEAWSHGLTPSLFWSNKEKLLGTNEEELSDLIAQLVKEERGSDALPILIRPTTQLYVSTTQNVDLEPFDMIISCTPEPLKITNLEFAKTKRYLHLRCQTGKLGSRDLRSQLPHLRTFLSNLPPSPQRILVCCPTGKDLSIGVALVVLCLYTDDKGSISPQQTAKKIDKTYIKQRLAWLTTTNPTLNPPRGTLQSINAFLMPDPLTSRSLAKDPMNSLTTKFVLQELETVESLSNDVDNSFKHKSNPGPPPGIPTTLFASLHNSNKPWSFTRTLSSTLPTHPSGTVIGTATFTPYPAQSFPTASSTPITEPPTTLLYAEEGEFVTSTNLRFSIRRKYIYRLKNNEEEPYIAVHFAEEEKGNEGGMGGLFVEMGDLEEKGEDEVLEAKNREQHLCSDDLYTASWRIGKGMTNSREEGKWWEVRYDVKGPRKDYFSDSKYTMA